MKHRNADFRSISELLLLPLLLFGAGCGRPFNSDVQDAAADQADVRMQEAAYAGDEACASCHEDLYTAYHRTGMGRSLSRFSAATAPERFGEGATVYEPQSDFYYEAFVRGDTLFQREYRLDAGGSVTYEQTYPAAYVIGSGNATRSYLMDVQGQLTEMPMTWYVERQRWDLSPGYREKNLRFGRPISMECMTCHNGLSEHEAFTPAHYESVPEGITCERCHGPGGDHVERHLAGLGPEGDNTEADIDASIVNPAHLGRDGQLAVCQQCHLTGTSVFASGESPATYRPGKPLEENRTVFVDQEQLEDPERFGIASHAQRLARSACFQESAMTCTTCHDPHQPVAELSEDHFNAVCQSCHTPEPTSEFAAAEPEKAEVPTCSRDGAHSVAEAMAGNCVSCHLQKSGTSDIPHVTFTDHWIRRTLPHARHPDEIERVLVRETPVELVRITDERTSGAGADLEEAVAYFDYYDTSHRLPAYLDSVKLKARRGLAAGADRADARLALGRALLEEGAAGEANRVLEEAAQRHPGRADLLYWLGTARLQSGAPQAAVTALDEAVAVQPAFVEAHVKRAEALEAAGRPGEAEAAYREALRRDPIHQPQAWNNLGFLLLQAQRFDEALPLFEKATALDPDLAVAFVNAGSVYLLRQQLDEAAEQFEQALAADADYVPALGNLGLVRAQQGRYDDARTLLQQVLRLDPGDARARATLQQVEALAAEQGS